MCSVRMPWAAAQRSAASSPLYSATLFVASGRASFNSTIEPSSRSMRAPYPAGPGLPREPPSMFAVAAPPGAGPKSDGWLTFEIPFETIRPFGRSHQGRRTTDGPRTKALLPRTDSADDRALSGRRGRHVIEDALAAVALDDAVVVPNLLEDGRTQAHVAHGTEAIPRRRRDGDALADARHLLERGQQPGVDLLEQRGARLGRALQRRLDDRELVGQPFLLGVDLLAACGECRFRLLHVGVDRVGFDHPRDHLLLDAAEVLLRGLDFMTERLVFAVGLHRRLLVPELGETPL